MLESVRQFLIRLDADSYPLGRTFDKLLEKRVEVDIENHLSKVRQIDQENHTNRAEALSSLISSLNPAHVKFLLCLQDSAPPPETPFPFQFGTLHPKFQPFAKKEYQKGVFSGTREEIEHLTLDIINPKNVPYRQLAAHFKTDASSALREGNVVGWVEKSLFKDRPRHYKSIIDSLLYPPVDNQPARKKFKYLSHQPVKNIKPPEKEEEIECLDDSGIDSDTIDFQAFYDNPNERLGTGCWNTWEERKCFAPAVATSDLISLEQFETELCRTLLNRPRPFYSFNDVIHGLKFTITGMENRLLSNWNQGRIKCIQTTRYSSLVMTNIFTRAYQCGSDFVEAKKGIDEKLTIEKPVYHAIGLMTANLIQSLERITLNLSNLSMGVTSLNTIEQLLAFLRSINHQLVNNDKNVSLDELINFGLADSFHFTPLVILIKSSLRPVLASLNTWLYEGLWTSVLDDMIKFKSRFQIQRNKLYWTEQYKKAKIISPIFVKNIDELIQIGKMLNLLTLLAPGHFILSYNFTHVEIEIRSGQSRNEYQQQLVDFYRRVDLIQNQYEQNHFNAEMEKYQDKISQRREYNKQLDRIRNEREAMAKARADQTKKDAKADYMSQLAEKRKTEADRVALEKAENEKIERIQKEKEILIEEEKRKMLADHEAKMAGVERMEIDDEITINLKPQKSTLQNVEKSPLVENRTKVMSSSIGSPTTDVEMISPIPKRKVTKAHMSDSAFVTGSMELKRNVAKTKPRPPVVQAPRLTDKEFADLAKKLSLDTIKLNKSIKPKETFKFLECFEDDKNDEMDDLSPLSFCENIRQSIEVPIRYLMKMTSRAVVFELLVKQDLNGILSALSGLMLFQDGVFADAYCDNLFSNFESTNRTRSLYSMLEESKKGIINDQCLRHANSLRIASNRSQRSGNILQNLAEVQLFMDITWPNNIIIDDEAMHTYKKINRFLVQLKFTQWNIDNIWRRTNNDSIMLIRAEMSNFLRALQQHCIRDVIHNQSYRMRQSIEELTKSGDLNIDSLIQLHQMFLKKCHTQCLLGSRGNDAYRTIHLALKMILQFCSIYQDYQRTTDDESLQKLTQLGADFRRTMVDIVRTTHALVQTLELAEERDSLMGLLMTLDYSGFYTEKAL